MSWRPPASSAAGAAKARTFAVVSSLRHTRTPFAGAMPVSGRWVTRGWPYTRKRPSWVARTNSPLATR
ncbi:hypothetical protein ACWEN3_19040, partial [Streptomyces sp. NPDC004561]